MKEHIDRIKGALATKDFGTHLNHYLFEPGWVLASDGRMVAAAPTGEDLSCLVPGPELEAVLGRFPEDVALTCEEVATEGGLAKTWLRLRAGRLNGKIETLPVTQVSFYRPDGDWQVPPPGLFAALKLARPFIAEQAVQPWALCACLRNGGVVATNNMSIITADCPGLEVEGEVLLPSWAVDFVLSYKDDIVGVMWNKNYAAFRWSDGAWFRTQLVEGVFPPQIGAILANPERAVVPIEKDWLRTYNDVAALSEGVVRIAANEMVGGRGKAEVRAEVESTVEKEVLFNPKFLNAPLNMASHWAPDIWPAPVPFRGEGFSGVVVGRKS